MEETPPPAIRRETGRAERPVSRPRVSARDGMPG